MKNTRKHHEPPQEDTWGFYGTIIRNSQDDLGRAEISESDAERIWEAAFEETTKTFNEKNPDVAWNFLRSGYGRHLADSVYNHATAVTAEALIEAIPKALNTKGCRNRNTWLKFYNEVKKATIDGTWLE